jgi:hypothetical protein
MNLAQVVHDYVSLKQSMGSRFCTEATILKAFCKAVGDVAITDVEPQQVTSYLADCGPVTRYWHRKYEALTGFYRFALGRGYVALSPLPNRDRSERECVDHPGEQILQDTAGPDWPAVNGGTQDLRR